VSVTAGPIRAVARTEDCPPLPPDALAVVLDVLRATSAMVAAARAGAAAILPVAGVEDARQAARQWPAAGLAGERDNQKIPGFDFGNSPLEWADVVAPQRLIWTTTNGTRALSRAGGAGRLLVASFSNRRATVAAVKDHPGPIWLIASGTKGAFSLEDWLGAGAVAALLPRERLDDAALAASLAFQAAEADLPQMLAWVEHGRELVSQGVGDDVAEAARLDTADVVLEAEAPNAYPRWLRSRFV
jgi:2-phosphosulfolactate phosphatase